MAATRTRRGATASRRYWLFKSEPAVYSIDDLARDRRTCWEGVRNYQARNLLRDDVAVGDGVLFYHSNADPLAVVGIARVCRAAYADHHAWDPSSPYFDPRSDPGAPTWLMVDVEFVERFAAPVTRAALAAEPALRDMLVLRRGARLSVQPVTADEWRAVLGLAGSRARW
ncbi:MAG: EVE domain-containing protein [Planctomycetes bacterium]|nr:EVE domain-containing protein [Planctomycetota bacterium]